MPLSRQDIPGGGLYPSGGGEKTEMRAHPGPFTPVFREIYSLSALNVPTS